MKTFKSINTIGAVLSLVVLSSTSVHAQSTRQAAAPVRGPGPTEFVLQVLGLAAQVAPSFFESSATVRVARHQANAAREVARTEGQYSYRGVKAQSANQLKVARLDAGVRRAETLGNFRIAAMNNAGNVRVARIGAGASRYGSRLTLAGQVLSARQQAAIAAADRAVRLQELGSTRGYQQQQLALGWESLRRGVPPGSGN